MFLLLWQAGLLLFGGFLLRCVAQYKPPSLLVRMKWGRRTKRKTDGAGKREVINLKGKQRKWRRWWRKAERKWKRWKRTGRQQAPPINSPTRATTPSWALTFASTFWPLIYNLGSIKCLAKERTLIIIALNIHNFSAINSNFPQNKETDVELLSVRRLLAWISMMVAGWRP